MTAKQWQRRSSVEVAIELGEESEDRSGEGRARASTFYRGRREVEALGTQWSMSMLGLEDVGYSE
jgi:hypothetical protein